MTLDFPPRVGGVARYLESLAEYFRDEIKVIAPPDGESAAVYPVERMDLLYRWFWPRWFKAVWILISQRETYDTVIVSQLLPLAAAAHVASFWTRKPYVVIVHGMDVGLAKRNVRKHALAGHVLRRAKLVIANTNALEREVRDTFGVDRSVAVHPCVTMPSKPPAAHSAPGTLRLLTIARLVSRKGHLRVLDALDLLRARGRLGGITYRIVGDGPMAGEITNRIDDLELNAVAAMEPSVPREALTDVYREADVLAMPTSAGTADREGFGLVYVEAAAVGVPSIATKQAGVDEAVVDGQTGLLVPDGDIEALADAIERLRDPETRRRLGEAARKRAGEEYTCEKQFGKLAGRL